MNVLHGARVLVVEDDALLLLELEMVLTEAGARIAGLCQSVAEALPFAKGDGIDVAILDFGLGNETALPIVDYLVQHGTPFCFYTGQVGTEPRLEPYRGGRVIQKPARPQVIVNTLAALLPH